MSRSRYGFPVTLTELAQDDEVREIQRKSRKACRVQRMANR